MFCHCLFQSMFNWADEFLGDESEAVSTSVSVDTSNLATNINQPNIILTSQNFSAGTAAPSINVGSSQFQGAAVGQAKSGMVVVGGQQIINTAQTG